MATVVHTDSLTKDFVIGFWRGRPHRALNGLTFEIQQGDVFGLLGPNGAGKSTTLKLLLNLIWPTRGTATVLGHAPGDTGARRRLGYLPEHPTFYDHLTAEELVSYFAGLFGYDAAERRRRASKVLDMVGLTDDRRRPLRQFSKGMVQRVGIAQALVNDPELIIFDEPMSGLDPVGRREVRELILRLRDEGRTVLFSSHILSDAELLCNRVGILSHGKLVGVGTLGELTASGGTGKAGRGWEVVVANLAASVAEALTGRVTRATRIAEGRYSLELPATSRPEPLVAELAAKGASLVSVTALGTSLEDVFLARVGTTAAAAGGERG